MQQKKEEFVFTKEELKLNQQIILIANIFSKPLLLWALSPVDR